MTKKQKKQQLGKTSKQPVVHVKTAFTNVKTAHNPYIDPYTDLPIWVGTRHKHICTHQDLDVAMDPQQVLTQTTREGVK